MAGLWAGLGVVVFVTYRPGGPLDPWVGIAAFLPAAIAAIAVVRPPLAGTWRGGVSVVWIALIAVLLVLPLIGLVSEQLVTGVGRTLLPSPEVAYAAVLATFLSTLYVALGILSLRGVIPGTVELPGIHSEIDRRPGVFVAIVASALVTLAISVTFGGLAWVNEVALAEQPVAPSRFGPSDPALRVPRCSDGLRVGRGAALAMEVTAYEDDVAVGSARLAGERSGVAETWTGSADGPLGPVVTGYTRLDGRAWLLTGGRWEAAEIDPYALTGLAGLTADGPVAATVDRPGRPPVAEDLGVEIVGGARARRCRTAIDGPTALDAFLPVRWLAGGDAVAARAPLTAWRGTLDWWVFADGELGQALLILNGYPGDAWPSTGIQGEIRARLVALDRGAPHAVLAPESAPAP